MILGNLTRDPELKYTTNGAPVCTFGVATNRTWTTAEGQTKEDVQYHRVVAWHKLAELCAKLLVKGRKVYCEGRISYRSFTGRDGQQKNITEIVLDDFIVFSDGRKIVTESAEEATETKPAASADEEVPSPADDQEGSEEKVDPDDIPF